MNKSEIADVIEKSAEVLEEGGWVRGSFETQEGGHCVVGAVRISMFGNSYYDDEYTPDVSEKYEVESLVTDELVRALGIVGNSRRTNSGALIVGWNDDTEGLTQQEVVHRLRIAAKEIRGE